MKKFVNKINKKRLMRLLTSASFSFLTLILLNVANTTSCFYIHEPKAPSALDDFKWIK